MRYPSAIRPSDYNPNVGHTALYSTSDQETKSNTDIAVGSVVTVTSATAVGNKRKRLARASSDKLEINAPRVAVL